jgi:disulfide bond formation protein DsbB
MTSLVTTTLAVLALAGLGGAVGLAAMLIGEKRGVPLAVRVCAILRPWAIVFAFLVALTGMLFSLFYSNVIGFPPCTLCWYQRICMYSLAVILGVAVWRREDVIVPYALTLVSIGGAIALYHKFVEITGVSYLPCAASVVTCGQRFVNEFGFVTIPTMSLAGFALVGALLLLRRRRV